MRLTRVACALIGTAVIGCTGADALAQSPPSATTPARVEVSVLGLAAVGGDLGGSDASLTGNRTSAGFTLFETDARIATAPMGELRVGVRLARGWLVEGGVNYARPALEVRLSDDVESAADVTATTRYRQFIVDGALVRRWEAGRWAPFVLGGAGYLRQLDEPRTTVGTGQVYSGGTGLLVGVGSPKARGGYRVRLRGDVRVVGYRGGLALVDERRAGVVAGLGLTLRLR